MVDRVVDLTVDSVVVRVVERMCDESNLVNKRRTSEP